MSSNNSIVKVFATTGSEFLASDICFALQDRLPQECLSSGRIALSQTVVERFSNQNMQVAVEDVRGKYVVVIHTQVPPVSESLMELFLLLQAIKNADSGEVLLVMPYMPGARSDRKNQPHISTMGVLVPIILTEACGITRTMLLDPHDSHVKHYFESGKRRAAEEVTALYLFADYLNREFFPVNKREDCVLVYADAGSTKRNKRFGELVNLPSANLEKTREDGDNSEKSEVYSVRGNVQGKTCILLDDEIMTGGTAMNDAKALKEMGAEKVVMIAVHPVLEDKKTSGVEVCQRLEASPIDQFIVTDSIPVQHKIVGCGKFKVVSVAPLLAEAISRTIMHESLTALRDMSLVEAYRS